MAELTIDSLKGLLSNPTPNIFSPQQSGLLSAAFAGLNASGPSAMPVSLGQIFGQAGQAGMNTYQAARQQQLAENKGLLAEQMQLLALEKQLRQMKFAEDALSGGDSAATSALAQGASQGDVGPTVTNAARMQPGGSVFGIPKGVAGAVFGLSGAEGLGKMIAEANKPTDFQREIAGLPEGMRGAAVANRFTPPTVARENAPILRFNPATQQYEPDPQWLKGAEQAANLRLQSQAAERQITNSMTPFTIPGGPGRPPVLSTISGAIGGIPSIPQIGGSPITPPVPSVQANSQGDALNVVRGTNGPVTAYYDGPAPTGRPMPQGIPLNSNEAEKRDAAYANTLGDMWGKKSFEIQQAAFNAQNSVNKLNRMNQLLEDVSTGKLTPAGTQLAAVAADLGFAIDKKLGNKQAAEALGNEIALMLRNPAGGAGMPGALSDADRNYLTSMVPGLASSPEGRTLMTETAKLIAKRDQDVARLARKYEREHGQLDNGFVDELEKFANENPLFAGKAGTNGLMEKLSPAAQEAVRKAMGGK